MPDEKAWPLLDWTDDGFLSGTELDNGRWARFDADRDGRVSKDEFLAGRAREPRGGNRPAAAAPAAGRARAGRPAAVAPRQQAARPAPAPAAAPRRAAAAGTLYLQVRTTGSGTDMEHWLLLPGNRVYQGVPLGGLEYFDIDAARAAEPRQCGTYTLGGGKMHIRWGGGRPPETLDYATEAGGDLRLDGLFAKRCGRFPADHRLGGEYTGGAAVGGGTGSFVAGSRTIRFRPDGTFTSSAIGGVAFSGRGYNDSAASRGRSSGAYQISGNTMILRHADGTVTRHTVYPYGNDRISVDGQMMAR
jgi:hypothetical protein